EPSLGLSSNPKQRWLHAHGLAAFSCQATDSSDRASEETDSGLESRAYHTFKYPEDLNCLDRLNNWASQTETVNGSGNHIGKTAPRCQLSPLGSSSQVPFFARSTPDCGVTSSTSDIRHQSQKLLTNPQTGVPKGSNTQR